MGSRRGAKSKGPCVLAPRVPLRYALPGVVIAAVIYCPGMRVTRGSRRTGLSVIHHDDHRTPATCGGNSPTRERYSAPGRRLPGITAPSEKSPVGLCVQRPKAPFFWTVHGPFSLGKTQRKWGKQAKRRQRRKQRACFEEAARLAAPTGPGIVMPRRWFAKPQPSLYPCRASGNPHAKSGALTYCSIS